MPDKCPGDTRAVGIDRAISYSLKAAKMYIQWNRASGTYSGAVDTGPLWIPAFKLNGPPC